MSNSVSFSLAPFDLVLFGGTGDLAMRKLLPAMYFRHHEAQLPDEGRIICIARSDLTTEQFVQKMEVAARSYIKPEDFHDETWKTYCDRIVYAPIDITDQSHYDKLAELLKPFPDRVRVFYLSTAPSLFARICQGVSEAGLITHQSRVALEKPLGRDLESALQINDQLAGAFDERQIYRIDHYLGKETVQNLMALRFGNSLFEPLWRREHISDVQITIAEQLGVEGRAGYYDHTGALRDMVQNHLLQLLVILAMEPPVSIHPDAVRDEKIKVLRSLKPIVGRDVLTNIVRGQYKSGVVTGEQVLAYRDADGVDPKSNTETYVAIKAEIESWRWQGVPFFLRTGKSMPEKRTEIVVNFRSVPHSIFDMPMAPNRLIIRLQPEEIIKLQIFAKGRGDEMRLQPVDLDLDFNETFEKRQMIAYERLLLDMIRGNQTLFNHRDEVAAAWEWIDPIINTWDELNVEPRLYAAGTWGPAASNALIAKDGCGWIEEFT
ncbi:glucose-6-phosphate dehydrogenase [Chromatiales bacterium (ex Bugula neritina AB1)]|nr:glucose-6-phosphate dehydrogenase [Chromatiales bacterium (ex Bugula neritina AB1)]